MPRFAILIAVSVLLPMAQMGFAQQARTSTKGRQQADAPDQYDRIVDAFIRYDVGQLRGPEGRKAYLAFQQLSGETVNGNWGRHPSEGYGRGH